MVRISNREVVGVFHDSGSFQEAIDELLTSGFNHADISLLATSHAVDRNLSAQYRKLEAFEQAPEVSTTAYVSPESRADGYAAIIGSLMYLGGAGAATAIVASGGAVAAALLGAALATGTGGAVGAWLAHLLEKRHADELAAQLTQGGLLLWVRTWDAAHEKHAIAILRRHAATHVHGHEIVTPEATTPANA